MNDYSANKFNKRFSAMHNDMIYLPNLSGNNKYHRFRTRMSNNYNEKRFDPYNKDTDHSTLNN